jgi:hypothetical protein
MFDRKYNVQTNQNQVRDEGNKVHIGYNDMKEEDENENEEFHTSCRVINGSDFKECSLHESVSKHIELQHL